jgi:hypothetical protein
MALVAGVQVAVAGVAEEVHLAAVAPEEVPADVVLAAQVQEAVDMILLALPEPAPAAGLSLRTKCAMTCAGVMILPTIVSVAVPVVAVYSLYKLTKRVFGLRK